MTVAANLISLKKSLPAHCTLIAATKTHPAEVITEAYEAGHRVFGENKVQELAAKYEVLPKDIQWHLIGHLQTNKVKYIAPFVTLIHSVDSLKLLEEINKQAKKNERIISCLLQVYIAKEDSKFGFDEQELLALIKDQVVATLSNIRVTGLMGMATFTDNAEQVRNEFRSLKKMFESIKALPLPSNIRMEELSMGMSGDYKIAIEEGSTMVRVGSAIFGNRNYTH
jgi:PLP dependent protein